MKLTKQIFFTKKVVISKFTLTCISLQTIWTQNISCFVWSTSSTLSGVFVVAFCASKCTTHSLLETGRDCRQASQIPVYLFLRSQDFVMCAECGFALSCWNMHGRPWKRCLLEGSILCSKISMYFSALMAPSQKCKLPLPRALTQPHTMTDPGFWTCCW